MSFEIGTDIESVNRFRNLYEKKPSILIKLFFSAELDYAKHKGKPWETLTGLWCAKEAVLKAFTPYESLDLRNIEISRNSRGFPEVILHNKSQFIIPFKISISISHTNDMATAVALVSFDYNSNNI